MIRRARDTDIPALVGMTKKLASVTGQPLEIDPDWTAGFIGRLLRRAGTFADVVELDGAPRGMLLASVEQVSVSPVPVAVEHGWFCDAPGWGAKLLDRYLEWAREQGCGAARMSTEPNASRVGRLLHSRGFRAAEAAWVRMI